MAFEPEPGSAWDAFKAAFWVIGLSRMFYLAFFVGLGFVVLLLPNARANAKSAGLGYTLKLIVGISTAMASVIFLWGIGSAAISLLRERLARGDAESSDEEGPLLH